MNCLMIKEALEAPELVHLKLAHNRLNLQETGEYLREFDPAMVVSIARGSSDHAASYISYLISTRLGILTSSLPPSLVTLQQARLRFQKVLALAVSQSGASPDICVALKYARDAGAATLALINQPNSPLEKISERSLQIGAGREQGIAATKSYIATLVTGLSLIAEWQSNLKLRRDLLSLPEILQTAANCSWTQRVGIFRNLDRLIILSRGMGFPIAQEIALKCNEVCRLPALAYSTAEFKHGPIALLRPRDVVLVLGVRGSELTHIQETVRELKHLVSRVFFIAPEGTSKTPFTYPKSHQPLFDPVIAIQAIYPFLANIAIARGYDPDQPPYLQKVTRTM